MYIIKVLHLLIAACLLSVASSLDSTKTIPADDVQIKKFPCPIAADIAPCTCTDITEGLVLNCDYVTSDQQLSAAFQADFPITNFFKLEIIGASGITKLGSDLDALTFREIRLEGLPKLLVTQHFLRASADTLEILKITNTKISEDYIPLYDIELMSKLRILYMDYNKFTWIPPVASKSSLYFDFRYNNITSIYPGAFNGSTGLEFLYLHGNDITELLEGTFFIPPAMTFLTVGVNSIKTIEPGAFVLQGSSNLQYLHADYNQLSELLPGTIVIPTTLKEIRLNGNMLENISPGAFVISKGPELASLYTALQINALTNLDQDTFEELFARSTTVNITANPLRCGCEIAWLVVNSVYMQKLSPNAKCADGTLLTDLDPGSFSVCI